MPNIKSLLLTLFSAACLLGAVSIEASAGPIITPISFTVSSPDPQNATTATNNILDQSGLSSSYIAGVTDFDSFVATTTATFTGQSELGGAGAPTSYFEFDFGSTVNIDGIALWNQHGSASLDSFTVETSLLADFSASQTFGTFTMAIFGGSHPIAADVFSFNSNNFRYLRINNLTNAGYGSATRINEVAFRGANSNMTNVPEPAPFTILGLGLLGLAFVRKRRT